MATTTRSLSTAEERREAVLRAAQRVFGARGLHGTPTTEIATAAGISHAYLFRLFPTKSDLVLAAVRATNNRIVEQFEDAARRAQAEGREPLAAMGEAYGELLEDREMLLMQLHSFAASPDMPEVREAARDCFARLVALVERTTEATPEEVRMFFAGGMLMNVMAAIDPDRSNAHWAQTLHQGEQQPC
ncbi:MAG: TetR/AcrR family transcriptional regulator [Actinomycetota bacterium]|nr:TetR/AcrR family transcriptional regulator [Actinomycetota bacterium]